MPITVGPFDNVPDTGDPILSPWYQEITHYVVEVASGFVGEMRMFGGETAPNADWMLCRGQEINRGTYAALFAVIGARFGAGNGSSTFNLPNMQGKVAAGTWPGGAYGATTGAAFGTADTVVVAHNHTGPAHTHDLGGHHHLGTTNTASASHYHGLEGVAATSGGGTPVGGNLIYDMGITGNYVGDTGDSTSTDHVHTFNTGGPSTDSGSAGTGATSTAGISGTNYNIPPSVAVQYIIKVQ